MFNLRCTAGGRRCSRSLQQLQPLQSPLRLMSAAVSPSVAEAQASLAPAAAFRPDLVIFDKDGTLVCFHTMWNSWVEELARRMVAEVGQRKKYLERCKNIWLLLQQVRQDTVAGELYDMLGYDGATQKVRLGMLAEKTHPYIKQKVGEMLVTRYQLPEEEAARVMDKIWFDTPEDLQIKSTGDLGGLFRQLKKQGSGYRKTREFHSISFLLF